MHHPVSDPYGFKLGLAASSSAKLLGVSRTRSESFHGTHKVPVGDTPYVRAKNVQCIMGAAFLLGSDGAAALVLVSGEKALELGLHALVLHSSGKPTKLITPFGNVSCSSAAVCANL